MGTNVRQVTRTVASSTTASVWCEPVKIGGQSFGCHVYAPAANLVDIEVSEDLVTWQSATDARDPQTPDLLEQLENERVEAFDRPMWARFEVRTAGAVANYTVIFAIRREDH